MRLNEIKQTGNWNSEEYSTYLKRKGYQWPLCETSRTYINTTGQTRRIPKNKPFALVTYEPELKEHFFASPGEALQKCKEKQPSKYQIINMLSGKILADPNREIKPKK